MTDEIIDVWEHPTAMARFEAEQWSHGKQWSHGGDDKTRETCRAKFNNIFDFKWQPIPIVEVRDLTDEQRFARYTPGPGPEMKDEPCEMSDPSLGPKICQVEIHVGSITEAEARRLGDRIRDAWRPSRRELDRHKFR